MVQTYGFTQHEIAKLIKRSKSYVSQVLGLERLSDEAQKKVQTSELSKEVQIQASRETEPEKQIEILRMASDDKKTVRDIRNQARQAGSQDSDHNETFSQWTWRSKKGRFTVSVRFMEKHPFENKTNMVRNALKEAISQISGEGRETGGELVEQEVLANENKKSVFNYPSLPLTNYHQMITYDSDRRQFPG